MGELAQAPSASETQPSREELFALHKVAVDEYRFEVNLGWERQKFFIGLNVSLFAALAGLAKLAVGERLAEMLAGAFVASAASSLLGMFVVRRSHRYYQNAREHFQRIERRLALVDHELALSTTSGMREGHDATPRVPRIKVMHASLGLLLLLAGLDLFAVYLLYANAG